MSDSEIEIKSKLCNKINIDTFMEGVKEGIKNLNKPMIGELNIEDRLILIAKVKGKLYRRVGYMRNNIWTLTPEESLYLVVKGYLNIKLNSNILDLYQSILILLNYADMDYYQIYSSLTDYYCVRVKKTEQSTSNTSDTADTADTSITSNKLFQHKLLDIYDLSQIPSLKKNSGNALFHVIVCKYQDILPRTNDLINLCQVLEISKLKIGLALEKGAIFIDVDLIKTM